MRHGYGVTTVGMTTVLEGIAGLSRKMATQLAAAEAALLASRPSLPVWRNGRRKGLKIPWPVTAVWVRVPPSAPLNLSLSLTLPWRLHSHALAGSKAQFDGA